MKRQAELFATLLLTLLLSACAGGGSEPQDITAPTSSSPISAAAVIAGPASTDYRIELVAIPAGESYAISLNDHGEVIGNYLDAGRRSHTFQWRGTSVAPLAAGAQSELIDLGGTAGGERIATNSRGDVLVKEIVGAGCRTLVRINGQVSDIGNLGGAITLGRDINDAGQVVGWGMTAGGEYHPFVWQNGVMTDLSRHTGSFGAAVAIDEAGTILLKSSDLHGDRNLLLSGDGNLTDLGNFGSSYAVVNDLNNRGQIVGWMADANGLIKAFLATPK